MWYNSKIAFKVIEATVLELSHWKLHTEVLTDRMGSNRNVYDQQSIFKSVFELKKKKNWLMDQNLEIPAGRI